jgi:CRP/FNR family transcriptional regulator
MSYEEQLANVWIFSQLAKQDLARIAKVVVPRTYSPGEVIVEEGGQAVAFYVILKGKVEVTKGGKSLATLGDGEPFGEMALLDGYPRATSVVAVEETECLAMTRWDFNAELETNPTIAMTMLPILSKRIRKLEGEELPG